MVFNRLKTRRVKDPSRLGLSLKMVPLREGEGRIGEGTGGEGGGKEDEEGKRDPSHTSSYLF